MADHMPTRAEAFVSEKDTYARHLDSNPYSATLKRRLYLGAVDEASILFMPNRDRNWRETMIDLTPSILSLWFFGVSLTYTYPRCVRLFKWSFPRVHSFTLLHLGIAPLMSVVNLNLLGSFKGLAFLYFDWVTN
jgi:hypothetical protein